MPECTDFDPAHDHATVYLPYQMCRPSDRLIWYDNEELEQHATGRTKELFYRNNEDVYYAGQFEHVENSELSPQMFLGFEQSVRRMSSSSVPSYVLTTLRTASRLSNPVDFNNPCSGSSEKDVEHHLPQVPPGRGQDHVLSFETRGLQWYNV